MKPIAIFYHCLLWLGTPPKLQASAYSIVSDQMRQLQETGLADAAQEIIVGINGGEESLLVAKELVPEKARIVLHGLESRAENLTIVELEKWLPGHPDWYVLYFHAKGCSKPVGDSYGETTSKPWREGMMHDLVYNWRQSYAELERGHDIVCSHWMWELADGTQHIPAGNFLWVTSNFAAKLPSIYLRERIKQSGIASVESRYEAEVYWGNGPRPKVKQWRQNGGGGVP